MRRFGPGIVHENAKFFMEPPKKCFPSGESQLAPSRSVIGIHGPSAMIGENLPAFCKIGLSGKVKRQDRSSLKSLESAPETDQTTAVPKLR